MTKEYPCYIQGLNKVKMCKYGGNKAYNYGFKRGKEAGKKSCPS